MIAFNHTIPLIFRIASSPHCSVTSAKCASISSSKCCTTIGLRKRKYHIAVRVVAVVSEPATTAMIPSALTVAGDGGVGDSSSACQGCYKSFLFVPVQRTTNQKRSFTWVPSVMRVMRGVSAIAANLFPAAAASGNRRTYVCAQGICARAACILLIDRWINWAQDQKENTHILYPCSASVIPVRSPPAFIISNPPPNLCTRETVHRSAYTQTGNQKI